MHGTWSILSISNWWKSSWSHSKINYSKNKIIYIKKIERALNQSFLLRLHNTFPLKSTKTQTLWSLTEELGRMKPCLLPFFLVEGMRTDWGGLSGDRIEVSEQSVYPVIFFTPHTKVVHVPTIFLLLLPSSLLTFLITLSNSQ